MRLVGRMLRSHDTQRGDTIVEVLIATAIISMLLVASLGVITRNVKASQDVQEHMTAQKLLESQVELLRQSSAGLPPGATCLTAPNEGGAVAQCKNVVGGAEFTVTVSLLSARLYSLKVEWITVNGVLANETIYYKVPPPTS